MIEQNNLPFQDQHYLNHPEHLLTLRSHIHSLVQHDLTSLQNLLEVVEDTLSHQDIEPTDPLEAMRQKEREFRVFQQLSQQNRERSQKVTNLSQLITHLLDFIQEQKHKTEQMQSHYEESIDELSNKIDQLAMGKVTVQNDVQLFKEQLHRAKQQIDELLEEKDEQNGEKEVVWSNWREKDEQVQLYEEELDSLRRKLNFYKRSNVNRKDSNSLRYVYSQSNFFPISMLHNQYEKMTQELEDSAKPMITQQEEENNIQETQGEGELSRALQTVLSNKSFASLSRNSSEMLHRYNSNQLTPLQLCHQFGNIDQDFDILPLSIPLTEFHKVSECTKGQSLYSSNSRDIFDIIGEKQASTQASRDSDRNFRCNKNTIVVKSKRETITSRLTTKMMKKQKSSLISFVKAEPEKKSKPSDPLKLGVCSSLLSLLVNKRIRRISQKANSGFRAF